MNISRLVFAILIGACAYAYSFGEEKSQEKKPIPSPGLKSFDPSANKKKNDSNPLDAERLSKSLATWAKTRELCGGNYSYKVIKSSFTGHRTETTIVVRDNKVVERKFESSQPNFLGKPEPPKLEWMETGKEIGSHKNAPEARTMDELYMVAKKLVEAEVPENHVRSLGIDNQGLLQHCFIRDSRIQDDAPMSGVPGIQLTLGMKQ